MTGGGSRWGSEFIAPVFSVYPGGYDPETDYDSIEPAKTLKLEEFGGVKPTPYPGGGTLVVRGFVQIKTTGVYELRPGYGGSTDNIMEVDGREVYRREPGRKAVHTHIKLTGGRKVPFRITYLTDQANGPGWTARGDIPGTLATVVQQDGKFPYLIDDQSNWIDRKDVWYRGVVTATADQWLSVGCGAGDNSIGPELGFGHIVGDYHEEPVLCLKASQGNPSLGWDYLPPGSERFEHDGFDYAGYRNSPARWEKGTKAENRAFRTALSSETRTDTSDPTSGFAGLSPRRTGPNGSMRWLPRRKRRTQPFPNLLSKQCIRTIRPTARSFSAITGSGQSVQSGWPETSPASTTASPEAALCAATDGPAKPSFRMRNSSGNRPGHPRDGSTHCQIAAAAAAPQQSLRNQGTRSLLPAVD